MTGRRVPVPGWLAGAAARLGRRWRLLASPPVLHRPRPDRTPIHDAAARRLGRYHHDG